LAPQGDKIAEVKPVLAQNDLTGCVRYPPPEHWPVIYERVEFPVLAAGIDGGRQCREELLVKGSADERAVKQVRINAGNDRLESGIYESTGKLTGVPLPNGKKSFHPYLRELLLAILSQILQEDISKDYMANAGLQVFCQDLSHPGFGLLLEQNPAYAVHANPVVVPRQRCQQGDYFIAVGLANLVKCRSAVFASAPRDYHFVFHEYALLSQIVGAVVNRVEPAQIHLGRVDAIDVPAVQLRQAAWLYVTVGPADVGAAPVAEMNGW